MGGNSRSGSSEKLLVEGNEHERGKSKFLREEEDVVDGFITEKRRKCQIPQGKWQCTRKQNV